MDDADATLFLEQHAAAIAAAVRQQIRSAARRETEALKAAVASQLAALDDSVPRDELEPDLARAIADLCDAAQVTIQITQAQLEGEIHNRMAVAAELQAVSQKLLQAKAEADALRLQLQRAIDRTRGPLPVDATEQVCAGLDRVRAALATLEGANGGARLTTAIFDFTAAQFSRVALCAADGSGFVVWRSRGFDPPLQRKAVLRVPPDSPLARAAADWTSASAAASEGRPAVGVAGTPVGYAIAVPIVAKGRGGAILYAENPPESAPGENRIAAKTVELLAEYVRPRLHIKQPGAAAPHTTQRRAPRVKVADGTTIVVDNSESTLVDLSSLGAQVVSPRAMHPDSPVHIVLPTDSGGVACTGRVVWVVVERLPNAPSDRYRAGVQFTNVKSGELDGYIEFFDSGIRH